MLRSLLAQAFSDWYWRIELLYGSVGRVSGIWELDSAGVVVRREVLWFMHVNLREKME